MPLIIPVTFLLQSPVPPHPSPRGGEAEPTGMMGCVCVSSSLCSWIWQLWVLGSLAWQPQAVIAAHNPNGVPPCSPVYVSREQKVTKSRNLFELLLTVFLLPPTSLPDPRADPLAYCVDLEHGPTPTSPPSQGSLPKDIKASFRIKFKETGGLA